MSNEIQLSYEAAKTVYFLARSTSGQIWSSSGYFENYQTANYAYYVNQMTEQGTQSAYYTGNFPGAIPAGIYNVIGKNQPGGSPLETDQTIGMGDFQWNGSGQLPMSNLASSGQVSQFLPVKLTKGEMLRNFMFKLVSAADHITPFLSGVVSGQIARDGGAFGALQSGAFTEIGLGWYSLQALTSGDLNADTAALNLSAIGVSGGASDPRDFSLVLQKH